MIMHFRTTPGNNCVTGGKTSSSSASLKTHVLEFLLVVQKTTNEENYLIVKDDLFKLLDDPDPVRAVKYYISGYKRGYISSCDKFINLLK